MKVVCTWCGKTIKPGTPPISHGMCDDCKRRVLDGIEAETERDSGTVLENGHMVWKCKRHCPHGFQDSCIVTQTEIPPACPFDWCTDVEEWEVQKAPSILKERKTPCSSK